MPRSLPFYFIKIENCAAAQVHNKWGSTLKKVCYDIMLVLCSVLSRKMYCKTQIASTWQKTPYPSLIMHSWDVTGTSMEQRLHPHNVHEPISRQVKAVSLYVRGLCDLLYCPSNNTEKKFSVLYSIITHCCQFTLIWMTADKNNTKCQQNPWPASPGKPEFFYFNIYKKYWLTMIEEEKVLWL